MESIHRTHFHVNELSDFKQMACIRKETYILINGIFVNVIVVVLFSGSESA